MKLDEWLVNYPSTGSSQMPLSLEARQLSKFLVRTLLDDWAVVHDAVTRQGNAIQKRWLKRNEKERRQLLLSAYPCMRASH